MQTLTPPKVERWRSRETPRSPRRALARNRAGSPDATCVKSQVSSPSSGAAAVAGAETAEGALRNGSTWAWKNGADTSPAKPGSKVGTRTAAVLAEFPEAPNPNTIGKALLNPTLARRGGTSGRSQKPEVHRRAGLPAKTTGRNCREVPPPGGTPRCWATEVGAFGWLSVPWSKPSVAPTSSWQPPVLPAFLLAASPCVAESLPLALRTRLRLPRPLSAHLPESQSPPKAKRPRSRRGLQAWLPGSPTAPPQSWAPTPTPAGPGPCPASAAVTETA